MVISRITAKKITVFDPAGEKKHISYADFLKEWTGYVLFFTPNEHFTVQKETVGLFARFLPLFRPYIGVIAQVLTASLLLTVFGILASLYFRSVIDDVVYTRALTSLTAFSIGMLFLTLFQAELFRHTPQFSLLYRQPLTRGIAAFSAETRAVQTRFEIFHNILSKLGEVFSMQKIETYDIMLSTRGKMSIKKKKWSNDDTELTLLALPSMVWYVLFCFLPMFGIIIAFKTYRVQAGKSFVYSLLASPNAGFKNFEFILKANKLAVLLRNTLLYNIVFIVLGIVIPVALAIMINELHSRWKSKTYQTMMFFPFFMSWVIVSYIVYVFLNADNGILNRMITARGGEAINWYAEPKYWPLILILTSLWKSSGYGMIVYLAQITGIDKSFYEAAAIDGANKFQQIRYITLPALRPIIMVMFILSVGKIFYTDFGLFYQVTQQIPGSLADTVSTLDTYVYQALRTGAPIGMISAVTAMQSVACCITILLANWLIKKIEPENSLI